MYKKTLLSLSLLSLSNALFSSQALNVSHDQAKKDAQPEAKTQAAPQTKEGKETSPAAAPTPKPFTGPLHYKELKTQKDFDHALKSPNLVVVEFYADWCGACNHMKPEYNKVAEKCKKDHNFYAVNIDDKDLAKTISEYKIQAIPTTVFLKDGKEVHRERGSLDSASLENAIKKALTKKDEPQQAKQTTKTEKLAPAGQKASETKKEVRHEKTYTKKN